MAITFPSVLSHRAAEVYPDNADVNLYYLIPNVPTLRRDGDRPVFRGLFWTDAADGATGSVAGLAGAQLNFDVNLDVSDEDREDIRRQIQSSGVQAQRRDEMLRDETERLQRMADATGRARGEPRVPAVGPIRFGSVQYLDGRVVLLEKQGDDVIEYATSGGPPSLMGTNNAAFSMRLGAVGAALWNRTLMEDASALGIRYELEFEVALPTLEIHIWAGSHGKLTLDRHDLELTVEQVDGPSETVDKTVVKYNTIAQTLVTNGLVHIDVKKGTSKISDDIAAQLRESAMSMIIDRVKQVVASRLEGMSLEQRRTGMEKLITDEVTAFAELRLTQSDVIKWKVNPQATITDFLGGITGDQRKGLVTLVDLSDPVVATLDVPVSVDAPWAGVDGRPGEVTKVQVEVTYPAARFEDDRTQTVVFDRQTQPTTLHWRRHRGDPGAIEHVARVYLKGRAEPVLLDRKRHNGDVVVQVPNLGRMQALVKPYLEDFALKGTGAVATVQLDYEYSTPGRPDHVADSIVLRATDGEQGQVIDHPVPGEVDKPLLVVPTYHLAEGGSVTGRPLKVWPRNGEQGRLDVPTAYPDRISVSVQALQVDGLTSVRVTFEHNEAQGFRSRAAVTLDEDVWDGTASLAQADASDARFRYRYTVRGDQQLATSPWIDAEGDGEVPILPVLAVTVRPSGLGLGTRFSDALLRLVCRDDDRDWEVTQEMFLTDPTATPVWLVPRASDKVDHYRYRMTLTTVDGQVIEVPEREGSDRNLVLHAPS